MNTNISNGMKKMFIAQIGAICCTVIMIIPIIGAIIGAIIGGIGAIVFAVISLIGLWAIGKEVPQCKTAFILTFVNAFCSLLSMIPAIGVVFELAGYVLSFLVVYLVCTSLAQVLQDAGASDVAKSAGVVWKINLVCAIADIVIALLSLIPVIKIIAGVLGFIVAVVAIVAGILYIIFLYKGSKALA